MSTLSRRSLIAGGAVLGGAVAADLLVSPQHRAGADGTSRPVAADVTYGPVTVTPNDVRYQEMVTAFNRRWVGTPSTVQLLGNTAQVQSAVAAAVNANQRISVRGGGHCYANFVYNSAVQSVIDLSMMNKVYYDTTRSAFCIEGGALLGDVYPQLFRGYGVTLPGGHCPGTGIGGHATGGGHGMLSRNFGLITDYISAVEMVVVNADKSVSTIIAERGGQNADLWWAVSGAGGNNFGVITKYWFRTPNPTTSNAPGAALPKPPKQWLVVNFTIPWSRLTQAQFNTLVTNLGVFFQNNSAPTSPYINLSSILTIPHISSGDPTLVALVNADLSTSKTLLTNYLTALFSGTGIDPNSVPVRALPWGAVEETINTATPLVETNATFRNAVKSANLITAFTPAQIDTVWTNMHRGDYSNPLPAWLQLSSQAGGQINAIPKDGTAISYRSSTMLAFFHVYWTEQSADAPHLGWIRDLYSQVFATTNGFPVFGTGAYEGCVINLPDPDVLDPAFNPTKIPWPNLYYDTNYPKLLTVKKKYDPTNFFRHSMTIGAA